MIANYRIKISASELHKTEGNVNLRDIILGGQDGLVNVLGLLLGIAVASGDLRIILAGGLAGAFAESVSMAAVAYTSTRAEQSIYEGEMARERHEIRNKPEEEKEELRELYRQKGFSEQLLEEVVNKISSNEDVWLDEMVKSELGLTPVETRNAFISSLVVGVAAIIVSLIPLVPFLFVIAWHISVNQAIWLSLIISAVTLFFLGAYKAKITAGEWHKSGVEIAVIGIVSALIGYFIGTLFKAPPAI
jgi:predicted membrane protein (TIGR00267 family)